MATTSTEASMEAATMDVYAEKWTGPISAEVAEVSKEDSKEAPKCETRFPR